MTTSFFRISARGDSSAYDGKTRLFRRGAFEGEDMTSVNCLMFTLISVNKINQKILKNIQSDVEEEFAKRNISIDDEHYIKYLEDKYPHYRKDILEEFGTPPKNNQKALFLARALSELIGLSPEGRFYQSVSESLKKHKKSYSFDFIFSKEETSICVISEDKDMEINGKIIERKSKD